MDKHQIQIPREADGAELFGRIRSIAEGNWSNRPVVARKVLPTVKGWAVIDEDQVEDIISKSRSNVRDFDFFKAGTLVSRQDFSSSRGAANIARLMSLYAEGGTIHISNTHRHCEHLRHLCELAGEETLLDVESDLWLTSYNTYTPYLHFDTYHIFVLQAFGSKRWKVWPVVSETEGRFDRNLTYERVGDHLLDVILEPGDILYLPPYAPHEVTTVEENSVHVGIGLHQLMNTNLLDVALRRSLAYRSGEVQECQTLGRSTSESNREWQAFCRRLHEELIHAKVEDLQRLSRDTDLREDAWFGFDRITEQVFGSQPVSEVTVFRLRLLHGTQVVADEPGHYRIEYPGGGSLRFPAKAKAAVDYVIESTEPFTASDLPTELDDESRLVLLRRLHRSGILTTERFTAEPAAAE